MENDSHKESSYVTLSLTPIKMGQGMEPWNLLWGKWEHEEYYVTIREMHRGKIRIQPWDRCAVIFWNHEVCAWIGSLEKDSLAPKLTIRRCEHASGDELMLAWEATQHLLWGLENYLARVRKLEFNICSTSEIWWLIFWHLEEWIKTYCYIGLWSWIVILETDFVAIVNWM